MAYLGLGLGIGLSSGRGGGTPTPTPTPFAKLGPGATWDGTSSSGGTAPAESTTPLGTLVQDEKFTGGFSAVPGQWINGTGVKITVCGLPPQDPNSTTINYFKECLFWMNGNSVTVTDWSVNDTPVLLHDGPTIAQGSIGFAVEIDMGQGAVKAGDAILYAHLRGDHGLERRDR